MAGSFCPNFYNPSQIFQFCSGIILCSVARTGTTGNYNYLQLLPVLVTTLLILTLILLLHQTKKTFVLEDEEKHSGKHSALQHKEGWGVTALPYPHLVSIEKGCKLMNVYLAGESCWLADN